MQNVNGGANSGGALTLTLSLRKRETGSECGTGSRILPGRVSFFALRLQHYFRGEQFLLPEGEG